MADRADADTTSDAADDATLPSSRPRRLGSRPRPPSVERLLTLVRPRRPPGQDPQALVATCRMVVQAERARLAASPDATPARSPEALADDVIALLEALTEGVVGLCYCQAASQPGRFRIPREMLAHLPEGYGALHLLSWHAEALPPVESGARIQGVGLSVYAHMAPLLFR